MKKVLLVFIALLGCIQARAESSWEVTELDGINYRIWWSDIPSWPSYAAVISKYTNGNSYSGDVVIPSSITYRNEEIPVKEIGEYAFWNCPLLTSVNIPNSLTSIWEYAFWDCPQLTSIDLPNSLTTIGACAFQNCTSLTTLVIPSSVTKVCAEYNDWGLEEESGFPYGMTGGCTNLTTIQVADGNTTFDSRNSCNAIIETATNTLVEGCKTTVIPEEVTAIGPGAFYCCSMTSITLPDNLTSIGRLAFGGCDNLTSIKIPDNVTTIKTEAFSGCEILSKVILPENLTSLGISAFRNCTSLSSINIPESLTSIENCLFYGCSSLESVVIPKNVTTIRSEAFRECYSLTSVISKIKEPIAFGYNAFSGIPNSCVLTVPYGTRDAYIAAGWTTDVFMGGIVEAPQEDVSVTIGSAGIATYCYDHDLDFSGIEGLNAYIVSGFSPSTGKLTLTPVTEVPAGEGLLLKGAEGSYEVPFTTTDMYYSNLLQGVTTATEISPTDGDQTNFILANGKHGIGFYTLSGTGELAAGKAYLHLPTSAVEAMEARCFTFDFENDEATGIMEHEMKVNESVYFDMQGRRVLHPSSGIYFVNGKKVIIK